MQAFVLKASKIKKTKKAKVRPREIHADVNAGTSLAEILREIDEREAKLEE